MPVKLGSFDAIIGIDWLRRHHAMIVCNEKLVRVPFGNETLVFRGAGSYIERESWLTVTPCSKVREYRAKGCHVFLAQISAAQEDDKPERKQVKDVPIIQDFPEVFPENLPVFMDLMNRVCKHYLDKFVIVFINDILIYLKDEKEHEEHLKAILELLKKEEFQGIHVDPTKIESVKDWAYPKSPMEIR
nr:putative reverse transcriptase domain-containing protein [Tanacetum cinerariifolium]